MNVPSKMTQADAEAIFRFVHREFAGSELNRLERSELYERYWRVVDLLLEGSAPQTVIDMYRSQIEDLDIDLEDELRGFEREILLQFPARELVYQVAMALHVPLPQGLDTDDEEPWYTFLGFDGRMLLGSWTMSAVVNVIVTLGVLRYVGIL